ncbi:hypothetical protein Q5P01_011589 [Channa striata]|uniref:Ig-like domain-containing protein n=1 Tax=Channa striata TaxID=64152 RepID=A0AA88SN11_CHASR|nr:hypothetical protein Q5P01_011589 [Channa striata]
MNVFIWATLLLSVRSSKADTASVGRQYCDKNFCIRLTEGEITAEAGLCVVIPCSFTTAPDFETQSIVWYKCESSKPRCTLSEIVFTTNDKYKVQSAFKKRVSLLEPDTSQNNCSIIINDVKESDSGSYQLRVNGLKFGNKDGFTFSPRATVSVKGLSQKPTVTVPPLTEGHQTTLTCTAPGLCSGSVPEITWTWRGAGVQDSHITGNITDFKTENLTVVTQRHRSTLTFNPSAQHHGTEVTCKVKFTGNIITEETVTLNVTYVKKVKITGDTRVQEVVPKIFNDSSCVNQSDVLTCVCVSEGVPLPTIRWPLLETHTEYSVTNTVSNHTVTSRIRLSLSAHSTTTFECVSSNDNGQTKHNVSVKNDLYRTADLGPSAVLPWTIAAVSLCVNIFLICLVIYILYLCIISTLYLQADADQADDITHDQDAAEGAEAAWPSATGEDNVNLKEVEYANIDVSKLKRKSPTEDKETRRIPDTEYTEVKKEKTMESQDNDREEGDTMGVYEEAAVMIVDDKESEKCVQTEEEGGASVGGQYCDKNFCIRLIEGEITAEAGLCVVIPCSFTTDPDFETQSIVWYKCESSKPRCTLSEIVFTTNHKYKVQSAFKERVSLLEPDTSQNNCSIIINDVKESDSGSYQLRVNGLKFGNKYGFTFSTRATVSVKGLSQKPTVTVPPLTEGHQTTLTCTAPGLCSGSVPEITWTWRGAGVQDSHITGNITDFKTETLTAVTQRHRSTLTFDPSAKHHGTEVTCKVKFTRKIITEETVTLNVFLVPKIFNDSSCVNQSDVLTCVCVSEGVPLPTIRWPLLETHTEYSVTNTVSNHTVTSRIRLSLSAHSTTTFECVSSNDNGQTKHNVSVKNDLYRTGLSQKPTVTVPPLTEGHQTTLTCTAPGLCSGSVPEITWTWRGAGVQDSHITGNITDFKTETLTAVKQRHRSTLTFNLSAEHHGTEVTCKVKFTGNKITEETVTLNVFYFQKPVITGITTVKEGDHLNLTCTVKSFPPSVLIWTKHGSNKTIENRTATLFITNVTPEFIAFGPKIFNDSSCVNKSDVLTCVCVSEGVPLPTIRWPLLETHTEYSVTNTVSNHTVTSRIRLSLSAHSTTTFECVSSNDNGQTKHNVSVKNDLYRTGASVGRESCDKNFCIRLTEGLSQKPTVTVPPLTEGHQTTLTCTAPGLCSGSVPEITWTWRGAGVQDSHITGNITDFKTENLTAVTQRYRSTLTFDPSAEHHGTEVTCKVDGDQAITDYIIHDQAAVDGAEAAWPSAPGEDNVNPDQVEYTDIDIFKFKRKSPTEDKETRQIPDTEYAEIKKEKRIERQDNDREEGETMCVYEEAAVMIVDDKESKKCVQTEEEGGEDVALYSNVNEIMGHI